MRIAIDVSPLTSNQLLAHRVRGVGSYIENLKRSLLQYDHHNSYIFFTRGEKLPKNIDVVHYTYFEPFFLTLPVRQSCPVVVTVHDLTPFVFPEHFPSGIRGYVKWIFQRFLLQKTSAVIADSECSKRDIATYAKIPVKKIHVVYLAASEHFKPIFDSPLLAQVREKYGLAEKFVLYVGDVTWNKNVPRLISAMQKINSESGEKQVPLVLVGNVFVSEDFDRANPWNQDLVLVEKMIQHDKQIIRLGFVPHGDLVAIYNMATVVAMPSLYEGFGLPVLEAMTCGTPVVTSDKGSIPEIAGESVYYVDPHNSDSIANGIEEVLNNIELQKELSGKGILEAKKFTWKRTAEQTIQVYQRIV